MVASMVAGAVDDEGDGKGRVRCSWSLRTTNRSSSGSRRWTSARPRSFAVSGVRLVDAVGEAGDAFGHHPSVSIGNGHVDLKLITDDAVYRDDEGTKYVVEWVTQQDVDLAQRITEIAADLEVDADPASVSVIELGLDTAHSATIAPVWAALLTGNAEAQGHGSPSDELRDATGRVPNLWFGDAAEHETPRQRFHVEVYVAPEVARRRIAAALAAGGTVVDDSNAPSLTVIADQDGNTGIVCVDASAARRAEPPRFRRDRSLSP